MPRPDDKIGPYTLISKLGRGAFGVVWLAEKRTAITTTKVAIKIPNDEDVDLEAVRQEAALWVHASGHPNVLPIIDADIHDEQVIIVSEYAPDGSLSKWLVKHGGKAPSLESAVEMTLGILAGLEHLHERGIIHRDLKPDNILLQRENPRLADFGISRILKNTSKSTVATGTPAYMPPEAFDGKRSEQTDIWSAGVIFYQLLSGQLPFPQAEFTALVGAIITREPEPLPLSLPEPIQKVVARALRKNQAERFISASEMRQALQEVFRRRESISNRDTKTDVLPRNEIEPSPTVINSEQIEARQIKNLNASDDVRESESATLPNSAQRVQANEAASSPTVVMPHPQEQTLQSPAPTIPAPVQFSQPLPPQQNPYTSVPVITPAQNRKWLWAIGGCVVLLVVGAIIYATVRGLKSNKSTTSQNKTTGNSRPVVTPAPEKWALKQTVETGDAAHTVTFSPDDKYLAIGTYKQITLWSVESESVRRTIDYSPETVDFSPDSKTFVTSSTDPHVKIWDVETGALKQEIKEGTTTINVAAFSPDGKLVAFDDEQDHITFWNIQTGERRQTKKEAGEFLNSLAFSPDGKILASCATYGELMLWDVQTGALIKDLTVDAKELEAVAFSPDGKTLASGGWDKKIRLWDVASGTLKQTLDNGERVGAIAFHPDGKIIAVGGMDDYAVKIWDVQSGKLKQALEGHTKFIVSVAFSPDGKLLASGAFDGAAKLWQGAAQ